MRLVVVSGMSGSGKSVAIRLLEDIGYYCIDNLPSQFLADVCAYLSANGHPEVAMSVDVRSEGPIAQLPGVVSVLRSFGYDVRVLFLTASTNALVQRFSETRRRHPLSRDLTVEGREPTLEESIAQERERLAPIDSLGHVIDTSDLPPSTLRQWVRAFVDGPRSDLTLAFGCTGGRHRSPYVVEQLTRRFGGKERVLVRHRVLDR